MSEEQLPYHERFRLIKLGLLPKEAVAKEKKPIARQSEKKKAELAAEKERLGGDDTDLVKFFKNAMKHMTGYCIETGLKTETRIYAYAIMSVCHILPKENVKSVMYDPNNWIELNCDFHKKFDAMSWEEREQLGCWPVIRDKLVLVYPNLDPTEHRFFPQSVLNYMAKRSLL